MENIMEITNIALKGDAVDRLSSQIHESRTATRRGLESAVPVSIAGLAQRYSGEQRAEELLDTIRDGNYPHADVQDVSRLVADPSSTSRLAQSGQGFLSRVFGNKLSGIIDALAGQSGVSRASASTLLGLAAPLVLDAVGKEAESRHLDARGLSRFLTDQARMASGALPGALSGAVGALPSGGVTSGSDVKQRLGDAAGDVRERFGDARERIGDAVGDVRQRMRGEHRFGTERPGVYREAARPSKMLPWILAALGLIGLIALIVAGARRTTPDRLTPDLRSPDLPAVPAPRTPDITPPPAPRIEAPVAPEVRAMEFIVIGPSAEPLARFLSSGAPLPQTFVLEEIEFDASSAVVKPNASLDGVAEALKQSPNARIRLEGHGDATGTGANKAALPAQRANSVKNQLVARGVEANRIEAIGRPDEPSGQVHLIVIER